MGSLFSKIEQLFSSFEAEPSRVVMLGLDSAGKTTLLYQMKLGKTVKTIPTIGFNVERVNTVKGLNLTVWDVGGQDKLRRLWQHYYQDATGLVFVVDSSDPSRFQEATDELLKVVEDTQVSQIPILVFANKQDMDCARDTQLIANEMNLKENLSSNLWHIQGCCGLKGDGVIEGLQVFASLLKERRKQKN